VGLKLEIWPSRSFKTSSLNRTSVGLKQRTPGRFEPAKSEPQSNQRGIETEIRHISGDRGDQRPQSNQRGIETGSRGRPQRRKRRGLNRTSVGLKPSSCCSLCVTVGGGLNRTSVGLKLDVFAYGSSSLTWPQSNQRGIETIADLRLPWKEDQSLNRTSVGLKPRPATACACGGRSLNRTSVGLKP